MIDTHSHIAANIEGLEFVVLSGTSIEDSRNNIKLSKNDKRLKAAVGIHPQEKTSNFKHQILKLEELLIENKNIVAVGECGLDFSNLPKSLFDKRDFKDMEILFRAQICLALKYKKPLIIHSRKAMDETLEILKSYKNLTGVIHCYTGGIKRIKNVPESFYFGIDGKVTYEDGLVEVVKNIPKDRLVLETDSPELTPIPHRFEKNCPEYVKFIYQKVAEIWGRSPEGAEKIIDENARRLFLQ